MLDPRQVAEDPEKVKENLRRRHAADDAFEAVDRICSLRTMRTERVSERDGLRAQRNTLSKQIGGLYKQGKRDEAEAMKAQVAEGNTRIGVLEDELDGIEVEMRLLAMSLPNMLADDVPEGTSEEDNPVIGTWGEPPSFDFEPVAHVEVGEKLDILDLERSAKLAGARFSVLYGLGARLERALVSFFLDLHTREHGYREVSVPYIVHRRILEGTGQLPKFENDMFRIQGQLNGADAFSSRPRRCRSPTCTARRSSKRASCR